MTDLGVKRPAGSIKKVPGERPGTQGMFGSFAYANVLSLSGELCMVRSEGAGATAGRATGGWPP